jgi:hypothetical protein
MKFSSAISWVQWLNGEKTNGSETISVVILRVLIYSVVGKATDLTYLKLFKDTM